MISESGSGRTLRSYTRLLTRTSRRRSLRLSAGRGLARSTVYRWLPELAILGLAYRTPSGWYQGARDAELVAMENGALDLSEARKIRHEVQRQGFGDWHEARMAATATRAASSPAGLPRPR